MHVKREVQIEKDQQGRHVAVFTVGDPDDHPGILAEFRYRAPQDSDVALISVTIKSKEEEGQDSDRKNADHVRPSMLRDLPLARWAKGLTIQARHVFLHPGFAHRYPLDGYRSADGYGGVMYPEEAIEALYPGLSGSKAKADVRKYQSLMKLATVAREYAMAIANGQRDITPSLAAHYQVRPATIRSWLFRAKSTGLFPPFGLPDDDRMEDD